MTIASTEHYRNRVEELGFEFRSIRPNWNPTDHGSDPEAHAVKRGGVPWTMISASRPRSPWSSR